MSNKTNLESPIMPYVLGVLLGDGCVYRSGKGCYVVLACIDRSFAEEFSNALKQVGHNVNVSGPFSRGWRVFPNGKFSHPRPQYKVLTSSKAIYGWFQQFNPKTNPDWLKNLGAYIKTPEKIRLFLKGLYESEGSVADVSKYNKTNKLRIHFYNKNMRLLELIYQLLAKEGYKPAPKICSYDENNCFRLELNRNTQQFLDWVRPCIKRMPRTGR